METRQTIVPIIGVLLLGLAGAGELSAQQFYYNGSAHFATGSYFFQETTQSFYLSNGISLNTRPFTISLDVPFLVQSSPWVSYGGTGAIPTGGPQHGSVGQHSGRGPGQGMGRMDRQITLPDTVSYTHSGLSDPSVSAGYRLYGSHDGTTVIHLNTSVKFPLADPVRGFGTGAWDAGMGSSVSQRLGTWFVMGNIMYWYIGDMPDLELNNSWGYGAGIGKSISGGRWTILGSFNGMTEVIENIDPPISAGVGIGHQLGSRVLMNVNFSFGLSESSSDITFGGGWQVNLN